MFHLNDQEGAIFTSPILNPSLNKKKKNNKKSPNTN